MYTQVGIRDLRADLAAALASVDDRFAVAVRTGRTDGALVSHLLAEGVHRDGVWYVIGVRTFQPADGGVPPAAAASEPTPRKRRPLSRRKERPKFKQIGRAHV